MVETKIADLKGKEVIFEIFFMVEIFPAPLPVSVETEIGSVPVADEMDLIRMSHNFGYDELFIDNAEWVSGECDGQEVYISMAEFLRWQLERFNADTIWQLINKTEAPVENILDKDEELENDESYNPESWLDVYSQEDYSGKAIEFINRLRHETPDLFYSTLIEAMLDKNSGILSSAWLECEIDGDLENARRVYAEWDVPLMVIYQGEFFPYIGADYERNILMDNFELHRAQVRNYDEGEALL